MKRSKFNPVAEIRIKYDEALERNLENVHKWDHHPELREPEVQNAFRIIHQKVGLREFLNVWPSAEVFELLDSEPKEFFFEFKLINVIKRVFSDKIPHIKISNHINGQIYEAENVTIYYSNADVDGWCVPTGWLYIDFAAFNDANYKQLLFAGEFKTAIDVLNATNDELDSWLYSREWEFNYITLDKLYEKYCEWGDEKAKEMVQDTLKDIKK